MKFVRNAVFATLAATALAQKAEIFYKCKQPNTIAFTIDDGPTLQTPELLKALKDAGITATFYVNCNNLMKDVTGEPLPTVKTYLQDIYNAGHEIGSHTYTHACLTQECITNNPLMKLMNTKELFTEQIKKNEDYIYDAIGVYPTTYRAPFGDGQNPGQVNEEMLSWLYELGYPYAIHWDIETKDMENANTSDDFAFSEAQNYYNSEVGQQTELITLQHAIPVTIEKIIPWVKNVWAPSHPNMKFVTVSECLGLPKSAVYKDAPGPVTASKPGKADTSDATMAFKTSMAFVVSTLLAFFFLF